MNSRVPTVNTTNKMQPIPQKIKTKINKSLEYKICIHNNSSCKGRMTVEHAFCYAKKQIPKQEDRLSDELFLALLVPCCWRHNVEIKNSREKNKNRLYALDKVKEKGLWMMLKLAYPKRDWDQEYERILNNQ